ncbi:MAG: right-handed parallel beta-helix repeat-containing protein [Cyanobacteria bacterium P01_G01_bin.67]
MTVIWVTNSADQGSGSLRQAVYKAKSGDTIRFDSSLSNQKITLNSGIWLNKSLTFDGADAPNLTISGGNKTNILWMGAVDDKLSLTVKNLTLADSYYEANAGGAIWAQDNSTINIENVNFTGNVSDGAALHAQQGSFITVKNSNFNNNDGASISDKGYSTGAISLFPFGELTVIDSVFTNNKGFNGGALHVTASDLTVENSTFIGNDATPGANKTTQFIPGAGGAIYLDAASVVNDPRFAQPDRDREGETEGGIVNINNSYFEKNRAAGQGGAIAAWGYSQDQVIISNNTIIDNEVIKNMYGMAQGGGIWLMGYGDVDNNVISNNKSEDLGGGLFVWGEVPTNVSNSTFSGNQATKGGAIYSDIWGGQINVDNVNFDSNLASNEGDVLFTNKLRPVYLKNSQFDNNTIADTNFDSSVADMAYGTNNADKLLGTEKNSYLFGFKGHDTLKGFGGNDYLDGDVNNDILYGGAGNDTLKGGGQNNTLFGEAGNDTFIGGIGQDLIEGGSGQDRFVIGDDTQVFYTNHKWYDHAIIKDFEPQQDTIQLKGQAADYTIKSANSKGVYGTGIFYQGGMIALVGDISPNDFSLNANYISYGTPVDNYETLTDSETSVGYDGLELKQDSLFSNKPVYNPAKHNGLIVWNNGNSWHIEATGDADGSRFAGKIIANNPIEDLSAYKLESNDQVEFTDNSHKVIEFDLLIGKKWIDGISFQVSDETSLFLDLGDNNNVSVKAGSELQEINS